MEEENHIKIRTIQCEVFKPAELPAGQSKLATNQGALMLIQNYISQLEAAIEQERLNAEEASKLIKENKAIEIEQAEVDDGNTYFINNTTKKIRIFFKIGQKKKM